MPVSLQDALAAKRSGITHEITARLQEEAATGSTDSASPANVQSSIANPVSAQHSSKAADVDHTHANVGGDCRACGGNDHWQEECLLRSAGGTKALIEGGLLRPENLGERARVHVNRFLTSIGVRERPFRVWVSNGVAPNPPELDNTIPCIDLKMNSNGDVRYGFQSNSATPVVPTPGTYTMRLYMRTAEVTVEDEIERQRRTEATVAFVDSIECKQERRAFWLKVAQKRAVEQGLGTEQVNNDPEIRQRIAEEEEIQREATTAKRTGDKEGAKLLATTADLRDRAEDSLLATTAQVQGGKVGDKLQALTAKIPGFSIDDIQEGESESGESESEEEDQTAAEGDSLKKQREQQFETALKQLDEKNNANARRMYRDATKERAIEMLQKQGLEEEEAKRVIAECSGERDEVANHKRDGRKQKTDPDKAEELHQGIVWCDDVPIRPRGSRGEGAIGIFCNALGAVGGKGIRANSALEMKEAMQDYEFDNPRVEELRSDSGTAMKGKMISFCNERDIVVAANPPYSKHLNRAESTWSVIKPRMIRVLARRYGRPPKKEWPLLFKRECKLYTLFNGCIRKRRGEKCETSMLARCAEYGTVCIIKNEKSKEKADTLAAAGKKVAFLWPTRSGIAYSEIEKLEDGTQRLGPPMISRDAKILHGQYVWPDADGDEDDEIPFEEGHAPAEESAREEEGERESERESQPEPKKKSAKRGRGRPPKRVVEVSATLLPAQEWQIEQAVREDLKRREEESKEDDEAIVAVDELVCTSPAAWTTVSKDGEFETHIGGADQVSVACDVIQTHTRAEVNSDAEWFGSGKSFKEMFEKSDRKEQEEVFEKTGSFDWPSAKPLRMLRDEVRRGERAEPVLLRFHQIWCTKGIEAYRPKRKGETQEQYNESVISQLKAKTRTVVGREQELFTGKKTDGREAGETFTSRTPSVSTQKLNICLSAAKQKNILQTDEVGMYPWTKAGGREAWGIPPRSYIPEDIIKKYPHDPPESIVVRCPQANYGRIRSGFDAGDDSHCKKLSLGWVQPVPGMYIRDAKGEDERPAGDNRGKSWGPDSIVTYVDDDISGVKSNSTIDELEEKRGIPRTRTDLREGPSKILGVQTEVHTYTEKEVGIRDPVDGEVISIVTFCQRDLLSKWISLWREQGRPLLPRCESPLPPGTVVDTECKEAGQWGDEARHHIGILRYGVNWTRSTDLGYAASVLASLQNSWSAAADALLVRCMSYVAATLDFAEYHIVSSREAREGLKQITQSDASHAGHRDQRGQHCVSVTLESGVRERGMTKVTSLYESRKSKLAGTSSCEEELRAASRGTTVSISTANVTECLLREVADTVCSNGPWGEREQKSGDLTGEELVLDAKAAISQIRNGTAGETSRHGAIRTAFMHEYWRGPRRQIRHQSGKSFLPDLGTKAPSVARFRQIRLLAPIIRESNTAGGQRERESG